MPRTRTSVDDTNGALPVTCALRAWLLRAAVLGVALTLGVGQTEPLISHPPACTIGAEGSDEKIRVVSMPADLIALSTAPGCWEPDITIHQTAHIEIPNDTVWIPIGAPIQPDGYMAFNSFAGTYDGGGHEVSGLRLVSNTDASSEIGFFSWLRDGARVQNLTLKGVEFVGGTGVGGLAGNALFNVSITDVHVTGSVKGRADVGGLVGSGDSVEFTNVSFAGTVEQVGYDGTENGYNGYLGGLIGLAEGYLSVKGASVTNTTVEFTRPGAVNLYSAYIGGLVGAFFPGEADPELEGRFIIENSHFQGSVSATDSYAGGLVGGLLATNARFVDAGFSGQVRGNSYLGGVVGSLELQELELTTDILPPGYLLEVSVLFRGVSVTDGDIGSPLASDSIGGIAGEIYFDGDGSAIFERVDFAGELAGNGPVGGIVGDMVGPVTMDTITVNALMDVESQGGGLIGQYEGRAGEGGPFGGASIGVALNGESEGDVGASIRGATVDLTVTYGGDYVGGLIGVADDSNVAVASSTVSAEINFVDSGYAGGLIGSLDGGSLSVADTAVTVNIDIEGDFAGGLVGYADFSFGDLSLTNVTVSGSVAGLDAVGGWIGYGSGFEAGGWTGGVSVTGEHGVGGLIGEAHDVDVVDSFVAGGGLSVTGMEAVGGLVGGLSGVSSIVRSYATVPVEGGDAVGGLLGCIACSGEVELRSIGMRPLLDKGEGSYGILILDSYATGRIEGDGLGIGGLIGVITSESVIKRSYATGAVSGTSEVGGLVGGIDSYTEVLQSYASGAVSGDSGVGGLIGSLADDSFVWSAYATGAVSGAEDIGGLVGSLLFSELLDIYATGAVTLSGGGSGPAGGLVGLVDAGEISYAYASGRVTGSGAAVGGLVGSNNGEIDDETSFWDIDTSGRTASDGGTGLPTEAMRIFATFADAWNDASGSRIVAGAPRLEGLLDEEFEGAMWVLCDDGIANASPKLVWQSERATCTLPSTTLTITIDPASIAADGESTATITATLRNQDEVGVAAFPIEFATTLGRLFNMDEQELDNPVVIPTGSDGVVQLLVRSTADPGVAQITASCGDGCGGSASVTFTGTSVTPSFNLIAVAGNEKIWLLFDANDGDVETYQYRLAGSEAGLLASDDWVDFPAGVDQPYLITDVENGKTVYADARAVAADGATRPSNIAFVTPRVIEIPDADIGVTGLDGVRELVAVNGKAVLEVPFTFFNTGQTLMEDIWLKEDALVEGGKILDLATERGILTRYNNRWFWRGVNLPAGERASGIIYVEVEE